MAVLIVVGGPQYRVGSHRQFVQLARALATAGFPTLRFDYTGMGDSEGERRSFEATKPDLQAALDALSKACPQQQRVVVWGLCDAASAALMFAAHDPRVAGIVLANPWVRSDASYAATRVKHYYAKRLAQGEFWRKLLRGGLNWGASWRALRGDMKSARRSGDTADGEAFQSTMARGLSQFPGPVMLIISGNDLTAKEFVDYAESSASWRGLLADPKVSRMDIADADHTFSQRRWMTEVETATIAWLARMGNRSDSGPTMNVSQRVTP